MEAIIWKKTDDEEASSFTLLADLINEALGIEQIAKIQTTQIPKRATYQNNVFCVRLYPNTYIVRVILANGAFLLGYLYHRRDAQCANSRIFMPLRFYVKSNWVILYPEKLQSDSFRRF